MADLVFLTGCGRSGTTILGEALGRHPDVRFLNDRFDLWIHDLPVTNIWGLSGSSARAKIAMDAGDLDDPEVREGIERVRVRLEAERCGARVLIEKLAINNFRLAFLRRAFPEASFINIERDGQAVASSIARRIEASEWHGADARKWTLLVELARASSGRLGEIAARCVTPFEKGLLEWRLSVGASEAFFRAHPDAPMARVRYEGLLADPGGEIGRLLAFLGLDRESAGSRQAMAWARANIAPQGAPSIAPRRAAGDRAAPDRAAPAFIVGVPRSGTTLLRVLLDSHSAIACGPETPWLCAHGGPSVQGLVEHLASDPLGYCASFGMGEDAVLEGARAMVSSLLGAYARSRGKRRWAEKTPGHGPRLPFLRALFPDAQFIVIERDGAAVAASTAIVDERRRGISEAHERWLGLARDPGDPGAGEPPRLIRVESTPFNAAVRWRYWSTLIDRALEGASVHRVSYERLVREPEAVLRGVCAFLGEPFEPGMLDYGKHRHDLPDWEWGSADVRIGRIDPSRLERAIAIEEPELALVRAITERPGADSGADSSFNSGAGALRPVACLASVEQLESVAYRTFMARLNDLARALHLQEHTDWSKIWEYPFLWTEALSRMELRGARVVDVGSERSPMPWLLAMLGARVTLIETSREHEALWTRLRRALGVQVDWRFVDDESLPVETSAADLVTSFSVVEHQADRARAVGEIARVLRPGGALAISFDVCEPGMTFPAWNGRAMTLAEVEREVWGHPAFDPPAPPQWNRQDLEPFLAWHRGTAPHHDYAVGAAVLMRRR